MDMLLLSHSLLYNLSFIYLLDSTQILSFNLKKASARILTTAAGNARRRIGKNTRKRVPRLPNGTAMADDDGSTTGKAERDLE
jgi:hypothetical protein